MAAGDPHTLDITSDGPTAATTSILFDGKPLICTGLTLHIRANELHAATITLDWLDVKIDGLPIDCESLDVEVTPEPGEDEPPTPYDGFHMTEGSGMKPQPSPGTTDPSMPQRRGQFWRRLKEAV